MEITAVAPVRNHEHVVRQIEEQIASGHLAWGQRLPPEREMSARFGVSRVVIREAIRVLGAMGLVEARHGSGVYVRNNLIPAISRGLTLSVAPDGRSVERLYEFRAGLEAEAARLAAIRRGPADVEAIDSTVAAMAAAINADDLNGFMDADWRFHAAISAAAANPYLDVSLRAVREMQQEVSSVLIRHRVHRPAALEFHLRVAAAIAAGDSETAATQMRLHIEDTVAHHRALLATLTPDSE